MGLYDVVVLSEETKRKIGKPYCNREFQTKYFVDENGNISLYDIYSIRTPIDLLLEVNIVCKPKDRREPSLQFVKEEEICDGKPSMFILRLDLSIPTLFGSLEPLERVGKLEPLGEEVRDDIEFVKKKLWRIESDESVGGILIDNELYGVIGSRKIQCDGNKIVITRSGVECIKDELEKRKKKIEHYALILDDGEAADVYVYDDRIRVVFEEKISYELAEEGEVAKWIDKKMETIRKMIVKMIVLPI